MWVQSLGQENPLEEGMATHSSILAWEISWTEDPGGLRFTGMQSQTWLKRLSPPAGCHIFSSMGQASFNFMATATVHGDFGAQENKICHCFYFFLFYLPWSDGTRCHDLRFLSAEFQGSFFTLLFHTHQKALSVPLHFLPLEWYFLHIWGFLYFSQQSWFQLVIHPARYFTCCTQYIN